MRRTLLILPLFILGLIVPVQASAYQMIPSYNQRYCEILFADLQGSGLHLQVYNTFALNTCPQELWSKIDLPALATREGHIAAVANGPRWWVLDRIGGDADSTAIDMGGGLMMRRVATLDLPTTSPPAAYTEVKINRTTTWSYNKDRWLRMLISPAGRKYVMQAYTTMIDPKLVESKLNSLGSSKASKLRLPRGWKFRAFKNTKKLDLVIRNQATVLQDNLKNTYQRVS